jgi:hypothetical protein
MDSAIKSLLLLLLLIAYLYLISQQGISRDKLVQFISVQFSLRVLDLSQCIIHCLKAYEFRYR